MKKYNFQIDVYEETNNWVERKCLGKKNVIMYKCLICNCFTQVWDETWTEEKKAEVKAEVDAHHNIHIIPDELSINESSNTG
jgi:hypothetical protein